MNQHKFWIEWGQCEKDGFEDWQSSRRRYDPSPFNIASFFGSNVVLYSKDDLHQTEVEKDLVLFIAKEFVSLSFVKLPFFRRLISSLEFTCQSFH